MAGDGETRTPDYRRTRIGLAIGLTIGALMQVMAEPVNPAYHANTVLVFGLLVVAAGLVGVDIVAALKGLIR